MPGGSCSSPTASSAVVTPRKAARILPHVSAIRMGLLKRAQRMGPSDSGVWSATPRGSPPRVGCGSYGAPHNLSFTIYARVKHNVRAGLFAAATPQD